MESIRQLAAFEVRVADRLALPPARSDTPTLRLKARVFKQRHENYLVEHYRILHSTIQGVTLAVAGLSAAGIVGTNDRYGRYYGLIWLLWSVSMLATTLTFAGAMTGAITLPPRIPTTIDLVLPMLQGVTEFFLFAVLSHQATSLTSPLNILTAWSAAFAIWGLLASLAISRAWRLIRMTAYDDKSAPVIRAYMRRLVFDAGCAALTSYLGLLECFLSFREAHQVWALYLLASVLSIGLIGGITSQHISARGLRRGINHPSRR